MRHLRRRSVRLALLGIGLCSLLLYVYYSKYYVPTPTTPLAVDSLGPDGSGPDGSASNADPKAFERLTMDMSWMTDEGKRIEVAAAAKCSPLKAAKVDIDTVKVYPSLNFNPRYKEFWNENFERRYLKRRENWQKLPLQVVVMPHSHNDPGWLKTFEGYYHSQTANILNNMVDKLIRYPNMTFVWSETSFLAKWWKSAHHQRRQAMKDLLASGRLELLAGGWVMTDEATVSLYSMIDQMIEGHQWIRQHLNVTPRFSWSIDPFGHGATMPYLLKSSGLEGTTVQRIHHGWKERLAELQSSDFMWRQPWDAKGLNDIFCHNFPFDIYNIKHSCGPHTQVCLTFDFRKIKGEFTEYTQRSQPITQWNVRERSETLLAQYGRTASLFPHNVALVLLGDDFRFDHAAEWDQQVGNYNLLFNYINSHSAEYNAHVQFGTLSTYYDLIRRRVPSWTTTKQKDSLPVLSGDFFVYSDVFNEGRPAYWSGYFTTRPYWKSLARELESVMRSTEIVYTLALARARQQGLNRTVQILEGDYERMTSARQRMADFQHHDAITGTSKAFVMHDFGVKLFDGMQLASSVLTHATQYLLTSNPMQAEGRYESLSQHWPRFLYAPDERPNFFTLPRQIPLSVRPNADVRLVLVNTLGHFRQELVKLVLTGKHVQLLDVDGRLVQFQLNPVWNHTAGLFQPVANEVELAFVSIQPPMSISVYTLQWMDARINDADVVAITTVHNVDNSPSEYPNDLMAPVRHHDKPVEPIRLENGHLTARFDPVTGFLETIELLDQSSDPIKANLSFQAYLSAQFHSGAYLFMPEPRQPLVNVSDTPPLYSVLRGPLYSEVTIAYASFMRHSIRVYHGDVDEPMSRGLYMENYVEYPPPPHFRETELFMRLTTNVESGDVFYTDQNCFQMQKRVRLKNAGPEVNYYPLTCAAYVEDSRRRLTLLTSHAHGGSSLQSGWLEVMLERRSMYDDSRGLGEGILDNKPTVSRFWLVPEARRRGGDGDEQDDAVSRPTSLAHHLSNSLASPTSVFVVDDGPTKPPRLLRRVFLVGRPFPCDVHVLNWRVLPVNSYFKFPSHSSLLLLHRQGHSCDYDSYAFRCPMTDGRLSDRHRPTEVVVGALQRTSLTALHSHREVLTGFDGIVVPPMEISCWNVTFA